MEVILREHVEHLGKRGEIVKVAAGYARNYLLPRKLALPATEGNKKHVERERRIVEVREAQERGVAEALGARLAALEISIARRVGDTEQLYGSVTSGDIVEFLKDKGFEVDKRKLILPDIHIFDATSLLSLRSVKDDLKPVIAVNHWDIVEKVPLRAVRSAKCK